MKKFAAAAAALVLSTSAYAADMAGKKADAPPPAKPVSTWPKHNLEVFGSGFNYALGTNFQRNYLNRDISQTAGKPGATAYGELRYGWLYAGVQPWSVNLPTQPFGEVDLYGGIRPVWGSLTLDFGAIYYAYPGNKVRYFLAGVGGPVLPFFTPGAAPTTAANPSFDELNAKVTFGETGFSASGAFGHQYLGRATWQYGFSYVDNRQFFDGVPRGFKFASYNTWNLGVSYTYKVATLDLRYYGSSLGKEGCAINTSDPGANLSTALIGVGKSGWCGNRFMASLSVDFTSATFK